MSRELLLARRLIEAVADSYAPTSQSEEAASELAAIAVRYGWRRGYPVPVDHFESVRAEDFSPMAWLLLLENAGIEDPEVPVEIVEEIFQRVEDEIVRLRLVRAALAHPRISKAYELALEMDPAPISVASLPRCWPKVRLRSLEERGASAKGEELFELATALQELVLYLLQDGSLAARALAAAAVAPAEPWRNLAHNLVRNLVRARDPNLIAYGLPFRLARI